MPVPSMAATVRSSSSKGIVKDESGDDPSCCTFSFTQLLINGAGWNELDQDAAQLASTPGSIPAVLSKSDFEINPSNGVGEPNIISTPPPVIDKPKRKRPSNSSPCVTVTPQRKETKRQKKDKDQNDQSLSENTTENTNSKPGKENSKPADGAKQDYIHVRARRGQATDSHSLAERVRREKISERMKTLQDLVPGCHKVTGKAMMLDEIINYVQSLQRQVEFLSMKLAAVKPAMSLYTDPYLTTTAEITAPLRPGLPDTSCFTELLHESPQQQVWPTPAPTTTTNGGHHQEPCVETTS